jgi:hypothetical protein
MEHRSVWASRKQEIRRRAVIRRSTRCDGAIVGAEPSCVTALMSQQTCGAQQERRLPGPCRPNDRHRLAGHDAKIDSAEHVCGRHAAAAADAKPFRESTQLEGDVHADRYNVAAGLASSRRRACHRNRIPGDPRGSGALGASCALGGRDDVDRRP